MKPYKGTAEMHLLANLRLREKIFIAGVLLWAYCIPGCAHDPAAAGGGGRREPAPIASMPEPHGVVACLSACTGATYAEVSPKGDLCRCWAPNAFQYTFSYPATPEDAAYPRERWQEGIRIVRECSAKGWAWEPDETGDHLRCVQPSGEHGRNYETPSVIPRRPDQSGRRT